MIQLIELKDIPLERRRYLKDVIHTAAFPASRKTFDLYMREGLFPIAKTVQGMVVVDIDVITRFAEENMLVPGGDSL